MKISLALGERRPLSRQTAWGCLSTNIAIPGVGSLMAGRKSGYFQLALALGGLALSLVFGGHCIYWALAHWSRLYGPQNDPVRTLVELWQHVRLALLGIVVFGLGWLWALATGRRIVREAGPPAVPPPLQ